jgi:hypothetical protein
MGSGDKGEANRLAVILGGCPILTKLLLSSLLTAEAKELTETLLAEWEKERTKLLVHWQLPPQPRAEMAKLKVLVKTIRQAREEGFPTHWATLDLAPFVPPPEPPPPPPPAKPEMQGIEHEVMKRLTLRSEKCKKEMAKDSHPLSARLPPCVKPKLSSAPHSAREVRTLHWTIADLPGHSNLWGGRRRGGNRCASHVSGHSGKVSALSSYDTYSSVASPPPRWDSSIGDYKLPHIAMTGATSARVELS